MAWAPGAWKTEFVESSLEVWDYIVIDIDKYRKMFKWYNGRNSKKYQKYAKKVTDKMHKYCIKNKLNFVLDWTFGNIIGE